MLILLTGGVRSGKSTLAARMLETFPQEKHYIATMRVSDEECALRVRLHRLAREGKGYVTHECETGLASLTLPEGCHALLDCLPNLLANEMFDDPAWEQDAEAAAQRAVERILHGIRRLKEQTSLCVIVTNETAEDGTLHADATAAYQRALSALGRETARLADAAAELVSGVPVFLKGGEEVRNFFQIP